MTISINKMVTLSYTLRQESKSGDVIEQTPETAPLKFVFGLGTMLPMFESNLAGLKQGEDFEMQLKASDAYGEIDENAIVELDKNIFEVEGSFDEERFAVGAQVPMQTSNGQRLNGIVKSVDADTLTMDFNHPLAGMDLYFSGNIIEVREATEEELAPSMGCGCGSGGCGSGEESCSTEGSDCGCSSGSGSGCGC
ncbi:FKBP-type peptidyl-prolyl cis-trans isomerase [Roseimarinus sediminis]|jgi:FKBP-type peptidyl-prolyl cis-trans isomerase SlyD|uniref:FKBP-type peptidyl-prolyl cis-trans isomerase n=1 Tax=Roseimarinus sediminis TaxID=1610899 RepID=UPI003D1FC7A3